MNINFSSEKNKINEKTRNRYLFLSAYIGVFINILLFTIKYMIFLYSSSYAVKASAFEHIGDIISCILIFLSTHLSQKKPDKEHPYGHGRVEYIISFLLSSLILFVGVRLFYESYLSYFEHNKVVFSYSSLLCLFVSLLLKFLLSLFYGKLGKRIDSGVLTALSVDSRNDCINTILALISLSLSLFVDIPVLDSIFGGLLALLIIKSGYDLIRNNISDLLGKDAPEELKKDIRTLILRNKDILGVHDLFIHTYGQFAKYGSVHVEVDEKQDINYIHEIIDNIEREIKDEYNIIFTIHTDPINTTDPIVKEYKDLCSSVLKQEDENLAIHDFRIVDGKTHVNLVFDIEVPFSYKLDKEYLIKILDKEFHKKYHTKKFYFAITFDVLT